MVGLLLLAVVQPPAAPPAVARVDVTPSNASVTVGDSVRLRINDPKAPREVARRQTDRPAGRYVHDVDVRDVTRPRAVAWFEPEDGGSHNVWVQGDTLLLGDYQGALRVVDISGELHGDLLAQGREIAHVHTGDARGLVPNAAMAWGAFYVNGTIWVDDVFSGLWAVRLEPRPAPQLVP